MKEKHIKIISRKCFFELIKQLTENVRENIFFMFFFIDPPRPICRSIAVVNISLASKKKYKWNNHVTHKVSLWEVIGSYDRRCDEYRYHASCLKYVREIPLWELFDWKMQQKKTTFHPAASSSCAWGIVSNKFIHDILHSQSKKNISEERRKQNQHEELRNVVK